MEELDYELRLLRSCKLQAILVWLSDKNPVEICLRNQTRILKNCLYLIIPVGGVKGSCVNGSAQKDPSSDARHSRKEDRDNYPLFYNQLEGWICFGSSGNVLAWQNN